MRHLLVWTAILTLVLGASPAWAQQTTTYQYDVHGRLVSATSDQTFQNLAFAYDAANNWTRYSSMPGAPNPNFTGLTDWTFASYLAPGAFNGVNLPGWWGSGNDALFDFIPGSPSFALADTRSALIPTSPGVNYEASVYAAEHRGVAWAIVEFYAADGITVLSSNWMIGAARVNGGAGGDLANYNLIGGVFTAPASTVYRRINLRLQASGGTDSFAFFTRPSSFDADAVQGILNPRFQYQLNRWEVSSFNAPGFMFGVNLPGWWGEGNDVYWTVIPGTTTGLVDLRSAWMPAQGGVTYEASVYAAQHRAGAQAILEFYASDQVTVLGSVSLPGTAQSGGASGGNLANFGLLGGFATAPTGTAYRRINLRLATNSSVDGYAFFTRPISRAANLGQTVLTNWNVIYPH